MYDYNIYIRQMGETNSLNEQVSAKGTSKKVQNRVMQNTPSNQVTKSVKDKATGFTMSKAGALVAVAQKAIEIADKGTDLWMAYQEAATGDSIGMHNSRAMKNIIKSGGKSVVSSAANYYLTTRFVIRRQNTANELNREIYNLNIDGGKFRSR